MPLRSSATRAAVGVNDRAGPLTRPVHWPGTSPLPKTTRAQLRARRIIAVMLESADQIGHRPRRGLHGGWPVNFDPVARRHRSRRTLVEAAQALARCGRQLRLRATNYRNAVVLALILA